MPHVSIYLREVITYVYKRACTTMFIAPNWKQLIYFLDLFLKSISHCGRNWRNFCIDTGWTFPAPMKKWPYKGIRWHFLKCQIYSKTSCRLDSKSPLQVMRFFSSVVRVQKLRESGPCFSCFGSGPVAGMLKWKSIVSLPTLHPVMSCW